jgi:23S rRNA (uracil1939-C5)-methyltransferase
VPRTISLAIDGIASGGDGVGRSEGLVVFVPRTAPGDVVTATIAGKGHFARGALRSITRPSAERIDPPCPHYTRDRCGGCQLQHITYAGQLAAKQRIISDAITRIGKRPVAPPPITPSRSEWRYRSKLTLAMRRRGPNWIAGLHPYDHPGNVFPLADCPITDRRVVTTWREILAAQRFLPDEPALRGSVRWTAEGPTFVLMGATRWSARQEFFDAVPTLAAAYWEPLERPREVVGDRRTTRTPAASFAQVNPEVAGTLREFVRGRVLGFAPATVIDAYSGAGELAAELAAAGVSVTAIELDADAARWAEQRLAPPSRSMTGRVEDVLPRLRPADVVVVNPPRGGLHEQVTTTLETTHSARAIVYVSCDPATLARDLTRLPSYSIASLDAYDMFPQTSHVETVCVLTPNSEAA